MYKVLGTSHCFSIPNAGFLKIIPNNTITKYLTSISKFHLGALSNIQTFCPSTLYCSWLCTSSQHSGPCSSSWLSALTPTSTPHLCVSLHPALGCSPPFTVSQMIVDTLTQSKTSTAWHKCLCSCFWMCDSYGQSVAVIMINPPIGSFLLLCYLV